MSLFIPDPFLDVGSQAVRVKLLQAEIDTSARGRSGTQILTVETPMRRRSLFAKPKKLALLSRLNQEGTGRAGNVFVEAPERRRTL